MEDEDPYRHFDKYSSKAEDRRMMMRALEADVENFARGQRRQAYYEVGAGITILTIVIWLLVYHW